MLFIDYRDLHPENVHRVQGLKGSTHITISKEVRIQRRRAIYDENEY